MLDSLREISDCALHQLRGFTVSYTYGFLCYLVISPCVPLILCINSEEIPS